MKSKRLTIILFSIITLGVTPRVMTHFKIYAGDLRHRAEVEWLNFLIGFGTPVTIDDNSTAPNTEQTQAVCTKLADFGERDNGRTLLSAKQNSHTTPRNRSLEFTLTTSQLKQTFESKESAPVNIRFTTRVREKYFLTFVPPREPAATYHGDRAKAVYLKTLLQSARMGNSRPTRALERELAAFAKLKGHFYPAIPATLERDKVQYPEAKPGGADLKADDQSATPEDSMR